LSATAPLGRDFSHAARGTKRMELRNMNQREVIRPLMLALAAALLTLAACESKPSVRSNYDQAADFGRYHTYNFVTDPGTNREGYSSLLTQQIEAAVNEQMQQRGYTRSENPDLLVNFSGKVQERQEVHSTPAAGPYYGRGYYGYRAGMYGVWSGYPSSVYTVNYSEGTLNIDIVDSNRKQMVWEGVGVGELTKEKMKNPQATVQEVVSEIFTKYPFRAGQAAPVASNQQ
jgi:uncharacterized protein DUF4136